MRYPIPLTKVSCNRARSFLYIRR